MDFLTSPANHEDAGDVTYDLQSLSEKTWRLEYSGYPITLQKDRMKKRQNEELESQSHLQAIQ